VKRVIILLLSLFAVARSLPFEVNASADEPTWGGFGKKDNVYFCASTDKKIAALTFDDGPHPVLTDEILDILAEYDVKATFFVIGKNAETYKKQLLRAHSEGHEIGNHTYSHLTAKDSSKEKLSDELKKTDKIISEITGQRPRLFRPPTGYCNSIAVESAVGLGYKIILWTVDTRDWAHTSAPEIKKNVSKHIGNGSIILFHDYVSGKSSTAEALRALLPELIADGYSFDTVSNMLS
jgi:peptidoglycan/xylan/chitin deacetylase (PgdA/CDA1 family)